MRLKTHVEIWDEEHDIASAVQIKNMWYFKDGVTRTVSMIRAESVMYDPEGNIESRTRNRLAWAKGRLTRARDEFFDRKHQFLVRAAAPTVTIEAARAELLRLKAIYEERLTIYQQICAEYNALPSVVAEHARHRRLAEDRQQIENFKDAVRAIEI